MTNLTLKFSKLFFGAAIRVVTLALFLVVFGASAALAQTRAYVPNILSDNVSVIDSGTNTVVATIPVGDFPIAAAVTPNGAFAYVTNRISNTVSVIDAATNTVIATVPVGAGPNGIAVTPNGAFVYVGNATGNSISVIDTATNTVTTTIAGVPAQSFIAITPNGAFAWVTNQFNSTVRVIDTATNTLTATIPLLAPAGIAFTPNGAFAYVTTPSLPGRVSVISTATNTVIATIPVGNGPFGIDITPNGAFAYVSNQSSNTVSVIDTATNTVVATIPVGGAPQGVAINQAGTFAFVANAASDNVSVIDTATNTVTATIPVGDGPAFLAFPVNRAPVAQCQDVTVSAGPSCTADASIDNGSSDPNGDAITTSQSPAGPYPLGATIVTLTVTDSHGASSQCTATVTVVDTTPPLITACADNTTLSLGGGSQIALPDLTAQIVASDNCSAVTVTQSPAPGTLIGIGNTTVTFTVTDAANNTATCSAVVTVQFSFTGFFAPVNNPPVLNSVNAGKAIPIKFSLNGDQGLNIFAAGFPVSQQITCDASAPVGVIEETVTAGGSSLSYDPVADQYIYVWKTDQSWAGTCRQLIVKLSDGSIHIANFTFK